VLSLNSFLILFECFVFIAAALCELYLQNQKIAPCGPMTAAIRLIDRVQMESIHDTQCLLIALTFSFARAASVSVVCTSIIQRQYINVVSSWSLYLPHKSLSWSAVPCISKIFVHNSTAIMAI